MKTYTPVELEDQRMTGEDVSKAIDDFGSQITKFKKQDLYYRGKNYSILSESERPTPDNRIAVAFARKAVNTVTGYMAKVGNVTFKEENESEYFDRVNRENSAALNTNSALVKALVNGVGYELHYYKDVTPMFSVIDATKIIPYYDDELEPSIYRFIYFYSQNLSDSSVQDDSSTDLTKTVYFANVYYQDKIEFFKKEGKETTYSKVEKTQLEEEHFYETAPIVEYVIDQNKTNLFDHVIDLIDQHDKIMSEDIANEMEKFANTCIKTSLFIDSMTKDENGKTDLDKLKRLRIFEGMDREDFIEYLTKEINDSFISNSADRFERLIYSMLQIVDFDNEALGAASGIALQLRIINFENLCSAIEAFFNTGLQKRYDLIRTVSKKSSEDFGDVTVNWIRNIPFDIVAMQAALGVPLTEVLSEQTILGLFPSTIVDNVTDEQERIAKEKQADSDRIAKALNSSEDQIDVDDDLDDGGSE